MQLRYITLDYTNYTAERYNYKNNHNYTALHNTTLNQLHYIMLQLQQQLQVQLPLPLHCTTQHDANHTTLQLLPHYFTLHYTRLRYTALQYTTLQHTTLHYTNYITPELQLQLHYACYTTLQLQLHYTTLQLELQLH